MTRGEPRRGARWVLLVGVACAAVSSGDALALTDEEIYLGLRFHATNAGARSLGMGGAAAAVADDATAADANPASLFRLEGPQAFLEYRGIEYDTTIRRAESGSLDVDAATGARDLPFLRAQTVAEIESYSEPSLLAVAWPLRFGTSGPRVTLAGSRTVVMAQDRSLGGAGAATEARFAFDSFPNTVVDGSVEAYSVAARVEGGIATEIVYWSAAAGLAVHPDFSFGVGVSYATLDLAAATSSEIVDPLELFVDPSHPRLPELPASDLHESSVDGSDSGFAYTIGVDWQPSSVLASGRSPWRFGAVFRKGAEFSVSETTFVNGTPDRVLSDRVVVPDRYALAASYRVRDALTVTVEAERVEYSDLLREFVGGVNFLTSGRVVDIAFPTDPDRAASFDADDEIVPRVGLEYVFRPGDGDGARIAIRAGYYSMPDGRIHLESFNAEDPAVDAVYLEAFGDGDDHAHVTAGLGLRIGRSEFQLAGDVADDLTQFVASYTFRGRSRP